MKLSNYSNYFYFAYVVLLFVVVGLMIKPLFSTILLAILFSIMFLPAYQKILEKTKNKDFAAVITLIFMLIAIVIFVIIPSIFFLKTLSQEVIWQTYFTVKVKLNEPFAVKNCSESNLLCVASQKASELYQTEPTIKRTVDSALDTMLDKGTNFVSDFILSTPELFLNIFIIVFVSFFLLRDFELIGERIQKLIPLPSHYSGKLIHKIKLTLSSIIYGSIVVAIIQGITGAIGYFIFGVDNAIVFGVLTAFVAFVPFLGTFLVWGLISIKMMVIGYAEANPDLFFNGVSLFIYGTLVISIVDNILKPRIIGRKSETHPILILLGVVGGTYLFGIPGLILGPVIMAVFESVINFYDELKEKELNELNKSVILEKVEKIEKV